MPDEKPKTINEEAGLGPEWVPLDAPPIIPANTARVAADGSDKVLQGSLPPGYQHDVNFTGTAYRSPNSPQLSLMPLGVQGNPTTNAGVQSTATKVVQASSSSAVTTEVIESIAVNIQSGTSYTVQLSDRDTLISLTNNSGGTVILPGPTASGVSFIQDGNTSYPFPGPSGPPYNLISPSMTFTAGNTIIVLVRVGGAPAGGVTSVTDLLGNTYTNLDASGNTLETRDAGFFSGFAQFDQIWYCQNCLGGTTTIKAVITNANTADSITVLEYSGLSSALRPIARIISADSGSHGSATSTASVLTVSDSVSSSSNNLVIAAADNDGGTITGQSFTNRIGVIGGGFLVFGDEPGTLSGGGGETVSQTFTGTHRFIFVSAVFIALPSVPGTTFPAGWFAYIQNTGSGIFEVMSSVLIDGKSEPVFIGPNQGLLVVFDGLNWFTVRGVGISICAEVALTGQSANISAAPLFTVPVSGLYRVSTYIVETTNDGTSSTLPNAQIIYTDPDTGTPITIDATPIGTGAGLGQTGALTSDTVGTAASGELLISAIGGTAIQYQTVNYASNTPSKMKYSLRMKLEMLN